MRVYQIDAYVIEAPDLTSAILLYMAHWRSVVWGGEPPEEIELSVRLISDSPVLRLEEVPKSGG